MRKILLITSAVCFLISLIAFWFWGIWVGIITTLILGALIAFDIYLINNDPRWWIAISLFVISFIVMMYSFSGMFKINCENDYMQVIPEYETIIEEQENQEIMAEIEEETEIKEDTQIEENISEEKEQPVETKVVEKVVVKKVPVEKIIEKEVVKEVPVEKIVEKEVIKEVPVQKEEIKDNTQQNNSQTTVTQKPTSNPNNYNNMYYGDPTVNGNYNNGCSNNMYFGDPTVNGGYNNGNLYGDPTGGYNNYYSNNIRIDGEDEVVVGETYTYKIIGVNSFSKSKLKLPAGISYEGHSGNKVQLHFEQVGSFDIGYGNATLKIKVYND